MTYADILHHMMRPDHGVSENTPFEPCTVVDAATGNRHGAFQGLLPVEHPTALLEVQIDPAGLQVAVNVRVAFAGAHSDTNHGAADRFRLLHASDDSNSVTKALSQHQLFNLGITSPALDNGRLTTVDCAHEAELRALLVQLSALRVCSGLFVGDKGRLQFDAALRGGHRGGVDAQAVLNAAAGFGRAAGTRAQPRVVLSARLQRALPAAHHLQCTLFATAGARRCASCQTQNAGRDLLKQLKMYWATRNEKDAALAATAAADTAFAAAARRLATNDPNVNGVCEAEAPPPRLADSIDEAVLRQVAEVVPLDRLHVAEATRAVGAAKVAARDGSTAADLQAADDAVAFATSVQHREHERRVAVHLLDTVQRLRTAGGRSTARYCDELYDLGSQLLAATSNTKYERIRRAFTLFLPSLDTLLRRERLQRGSSNEESLQVHIHSFMSALKEDVKVYRAVQQGKGFNISEDFALHMVSQFLVLSFDEMTCHRALIPERISGRATGRVTGLGRLDPTRLLVSTVRDMSDGVTSERVATTICNFTVRSVFTGLRSPVASFAISGAIIAPQVLLLKARVEMLLSVAGCRLVLSTCDAAMPNRAVWRLNMTDSADVADLVFAECELRAEVEAQRAGEMAHKYVGPAPGNVPVKAGRRYALCGGAGTSRGSLWARQPHLRTNVRYDNSRAKLAGIVDALSIDDALSVPLDVADATHTLKRIGTALRRKHGVYVIDGYQREHGPSTAGGTDDIADSADDDDDRVPLAGDDDDTEGDTADATEIAAAEMATETERQARFSKSRENCDGGILSVRDFNEFTDSGGNDGRFVSIDGTNRALGPAYLTNLYDKRVSGVDMTVAERNCMAMDVRVHRRLVDPSMRLFLDDYITHGGIDDEVYTCGGAAGAASASGGDARVMSARAFRLAPLTHFLELLAPSLHFLTSNDHIIKDVLLSTYPDLDSALDFVHRADLGVLLARDLTTLLRFWRTGVVKWFEDVEQAWHSMCGGREMPVFALRPLRLTQDFCEKIHALMRASAGSMSTVTPNSAKATAKKFNTKNASRDHSSKAIRDARRSVAGVKKRKTSGKRNERANKRRPMW